MSALGDVLPMVGRWPRLRTLWDNPLMNGPALEVERSSFVDAYSVILQCSTQQITSPICATVILQIIAADSFVCCCQIVSLHVEYFLAKCQCTTLEL